MKYYIQTFGCQMNVYDTDSMIGLLNEVGHEHVASAEEAEMILLNTCSVREGAEERVRGRIGQLKRLKDRGILKYLGVCGCMGQKEGERLTDAIPFLDLVMGPGAIGSVARLVAELEKGRRPVLDLTGIEDEYDQAFPVAREEITYPRFLSVMKGCNKHCTFCVVPFTRGPERSRAPQIILQEAETLAQRGYKEITLIGQTINSYRYGRIRFPELLALVDQIPGIERVRFATSYPGTSCRNLFEAMASLPHVCEQLHLPVQSGSNRVLKGMKRIYTREKYLEYIDYFRSLYRNHPVPPAVTTDIIVGFPGETEEDFEQTLDLVRTVRFDAAFMFKYSSRRGTLAATLAGPIDEFTKARRLDRLIKLEHQIAQELNEAWIGKPAEVMVERVASDSDQGKIYEARMRTGRVLKVAGEGLSYKVGDILNVTVTGCSAHNLYEVPSPLETIHDEV